MTKTKGFLLAWTVSVLGCAHSPADRQAATAKETARYVDNCPVDRIKTTEPFATGNDITEPIASNWTAVACERDYVCKLTTRPGTLGDHVTECKETPKSREATATKVATDRLAIETGCPAANIKLVSSTDWTRGDERSYAMMACGKRYTCTTAPRGTDCKKSLMDEAGPTPDGAAR